VRRLLWILLVVEAALVFCALKGALGGNAIVLLLAANSALLIWSFQRSRRKSSCCR
jgi:hypothetical protein